MSPLCRGVQQVETIDARRLKESPEITDGARRRLGWRAAREVTYFALLLGFRRHEEEEDERLARELAGGGRNVRRRTG